MTVNDRFERRLPNLLAGLAETDTSDLLADVLSSTTTLRPRPGWIHLAWWLPTAATLPLRLRLGLRALPILIVVLLALLLALAAAILVGSRSLETKPLPSGDLMEPTTDLALGPRSGAAAALLADGRVLVVGGSNPVAEIYDPATKRFTPTGAMAIARSEPILTVLADGRVLVVGGNSTSAELYDPRTGAFALTGVMRVARQVCHCGVTYRDLTRPSAIRLVDGRVFVAGGSGPTYADIYDPASGLFAEAEIGCKAARGAQALLGDGRVLVTCLEGGLGSNRATLFDPRTNTFAETGRPTTTDSGAATLLSDGNVLLTGDGLALDAGHAEIYDPVTGSFTDLGIENSPTADRSVVTLPDGRVLFIGAQNTGSSVFRPPTRDFTHVYIQSNSISEAPDLIPLRDGRILILGDAVNGVLFDPRGL